MSRTENTASQIEALTPMVNAVRPLDFMAWAERIARLPGFDLNTITAIYRSGLVHRCSVTGEHFMVA